MKKIMLTATAFLFTVAMFAQSTGNAAVAAKSTSKQVTAQSTQQAEAQKTEVKGDKKKCCGGKACHNKPKEHSEK